MQKIYSSARYISFALREPGKTYYMFLGRGKGYEGIWFGEKQIESSLRKIDQFLEYLRKHLTSTQIIDLQIDKKDRVLIFQYQKYGKENFFEVFYSGRRTYFLHYYYDFKKEDFTVFTSWSKKRNREEVKFLEDFFDEVGRTTQGQENKLNSIDINELLKNEKKEGLKSIILKKEKKFLERKKQNILSDLNVVNDSNLILNFIEENSDLASLEQTFFIGKVRVKLKAKEHFKRRDELYLKIKKLKKAKEILSLRLKDTLLKLENRGDTELKSSSLDIIRIGIKEEKIEKKLLKTENYRIVNIGQYLAGYGLSAQGNDQLRKEWGSKEDLWFHIADNQSAHIILKADTVPDLEVFTAIGKMIATLSGIKTSEINLVYTQVKNLKGVTGKAGSVTFKKEKYIRVYV